MDRSRQFMSWDNFVYAIDFLESNHVTALSLMGGEPSLHPDFLDITAYALRRMQNVTIFTSGVMTSATVAGLRELTADPAASGRLLFVCNVNEADITPPQQWIRTAEFLEAFGPMVAQGFNIYRLDFNLDLLIENIPRYDLKRSIRLGLAHPIHGAATECLDTTQYREAVARLAAFVPKLQTFKIQLMFDCGFALCDFRDEFLGQLMKMNASLQWKCAPVVDIGPDLAVWPCFPLSAYNKQRLTDFDSMSQIINHFTTLLRNETAGIPGMYDECDACEYQQERCTGGCLVHRLSHQLADTEEQSKKTVDILENPAGVQDADPGGS